jgi:hypothetical protein
MYMCVCVSTKPFSGIYDFYLSMCALYIERVHEPGFVPLDHLCFIASQSTMIVVCIRISFPFMYILDEQFDVSLYIYILFITVLVIVSSVIFFFMLYIDDEDGKKITQKKSFHLYICVKRKV